MFVGRHGETRPIRALPGNLGLRRSTTENLLRYVLDDICDYLDSLLELKVRGIWNFPST